MVGEQVVDGDDVEVVVRQPLRKRVRCTASHGRWALPQIHTGTLKPAVRATAKPRLEHEDSGIFCTTAVYS